MTTSDTEKRKLFANALDRASTACLTAGVVAPLAAATYFPPETTVPSWVLTIGAFCWLSAAIALHLFARLVLEGLDQ